jgi:uncharacterized coiled-coil DUF342 family protein
VKISVEELEWLRSHLSPINNADLEAFENRITMKVSELNGTLAQIKTVSLKAFGEIRAKIDELDAKIVALQDADLPAEVVAAIDELKTLSTQLDDIVPDVAEFPAGTVPATPVTPAPEGSALNQPNNPPAR